ncbi:MAG: Fic family protein [Gammaproteobacteria bacterium]|nr:Fic family protein [Gammaproteobacteria bacterium]
MNFEKMKVNSLPMSSPDGIPTVIALPLERQEVLIGDEAVDAPDQQFLKLGNWKMLLGKSEAELRTELISNTELARVMDRQDLPLLAKKYFKILLEQSIAQLDELTEKPQIIIGIPPTTSENQIQWRQKYKKQIETIFQELGYPKPKFWPEPFAVFQFHINDMDNLEEQKNVLIIDIGGGTTDVCLIQTTKFGKLARGGQNHVPHGVTSAEIGGTTLDSCLAEVLQVEGSVGAMQQIKKSKETLSNSITEKVNKSNLQRHSFYWNNRNVEVSQTLVETVFEERVWPAVDAVIDESLDNVQSSNLGVKEVHFVILAGGTCQMSFVRKLIESKLGKDTLFKDAEYIVSPDYKKAVAHGLAIEAAANSRHHGMKPARVEPFLQEDVRFQCGHNAGELYLPLKMNSPFGVKSDLRKGILLKAPMSLNKLMNKTRSWEFNLRQDSRNLFYRFCKITGAETEDELGNHWQRISRYRNQRSKRHLQLSMTLQEDGFAKFEVDTSENLRFALDPPIDLHDLSGIEGETFFSIDFGTDNTQLAFAKLKDLDLLQALPTNYFCDQRTQSRTNDLVRRLEEVLENNVNRQDLITSLNKEEEIDYVYHSNRIEGSQLDRGQTEMVLQISGPNNDNVRANSISQFAKPGMIIDGKIVAGKMVKDCGAAQSLRNAFRLVAEYATDHEVPLHVTMIREIHQQTMLGDEDADPGNFRKANVEISGSAFVPPDHIQIEQFCEEMLARFRSSEFTALNPIRQAVEAHVRFVSIHPFKDGNGRVARLLANYFMWRANLPGLLLPWLHRERYYDALELCNSKEATKIGNLTELTNLFCDVLEDTITKLENSVEQNVEDAQRSVVIDEVEPDSEFGRLIERLTSNQASVVPLRLEEQYDDWYNAMSGVVAELKELSGQLSRTLRGLRAGEVRVRDFPFIDFETYRSIRERRTMERAWCLKITFEFPEEEEELVFHFGPSSKMAEETNADLRQTCSLHLSRLVPEELRHIHVAEQDWSRIVEITHDGGKMGIITRSPDTETYVYQTGEASMVKNWFGILVQDFLDSRN